MAGKKLFLVPTSVPKVQICYDFVSASEEQYLISKVDDVGGSSSEDSNTAKKVNGWKDLNGRRSMYWGGTVTDKQTLIPTSFPPFMDTAFPNILNRITETDVFDLAESSGSVKGKGPNHCLVNEYLPGQGIMPHTDGPAYEPIVSTLSLGTHTVLTLEPRRSDDPPSSPSKPITIFLPTRSLVILSETLYSDYLHSIEPIKFDKMEDLQACLNWESYWESGAALDGFVALDTLRIDAEDEEGVQEEESLTQKVEVGKEEAIKELVARRRLVESGQGWERGRRISLTCRRVSKVRKGFRLG